MTCVCDVEEVEFLKDSVEAAYPYLVNKIIDDTMLFELNYVRIAYDKNCPLSIERKIKLRKLVETYLEQHTLPEDTISSLNQLLEEYHCVY